MKELAKLTWPEARELFGPDLVAIQPVGSTEPHGPHLPLDTDVTIAVAQARRAGDLLAAQGVESLLLPAIPLGITHYTEGFEGRITLRPGTLWTLLEDVVESLENQGIERIVLSNGHLEPAHVKLLRDFLLDHGERGKGRAQVVFPDNTRRRWAGTLGEEFAGGDCHAGRYETSIVLARDPGSVREGERAALPSLDIGLIEKMRAGVTSFREAGASDAYCGDPAAASAGEGEERIEGLARMITETVRETWPDLFG